MGEKAEAFTRVAEGKDSVYLRLGITGHGRANNSKSLDLFVQRGRQGPIKKVLSQTWAGRKKKAIDSLLAGLKDNEELRGDVLDNGLVILSVDKASGSKNIKRKYLKHFVKKFDQTFSKKCIFYK